MDRIADNPVAGDEAVIRAENDIAPHPLRFDQIRIENTNHCGYKCIMCPRDKQTRAMGFMALEDLDMVFQKLGGFHGQIHLHGFGEPLLDKQLSDKVRLARKRCPNGLPLFFTTLGVPKDDAYFRDLASAGLAHVAVSFYGFTRVTYKAVAQVDTFDVARRNLEALVEARTAVGAKFSIALHTWFENVWHTWPDEVRQQRADFSAWVQSIGVQSNEIGNVHNFGDGRTYNKPATEGVCSVAWGFRQRILQVTWNLDVVPCCFDYNASVKFGNLREQSLEEIFSSPAYHSFIKAHREGRIGDYPVCVACERCFIP
jgi:MoaA/NifB/PqqE/SkfB family radical SAM enzyme